MDYSVRVTYRTDHNKNKDMSEFDCDLIDLDSLDFSDEQTWLYKVPGDSGRNVDIGKWCRTIEWPIYDDEDYEKTQKKLTCVLDEIDKRQTVAMPERHKFDSRTFVRPKKSYQRPTIQSIVEASTPPSLPNALNTNRYMTYNKYNAPPSYSAPPLDENDSMLDDVNMTLVSEGSQRVSAEYVPNVPIKIDLSQPAHNIPSTFNRGLMKDRVSMIMDQSAESLLRVSPPSLIWSSHLETSGIFAESFDLRKSINSKDFSMPQSGRESKDPMNTSMSLSILDEKDMNTSFLSQTTHPDDALDSLPPSLVSSVTSSYNPNKQQTDSSEYNHVFKSTTYTRLEPIEKLLPARPRHQMYNINNPMRSSGSYTKAVDPNYIDNGKVLNDNIDKTEPNSGKEMSETITLHFSNNKFRKNSNAGKENLNSSFEKDETFYKEMGLHRPVESRISNVTLDKQELNEIIQARQKLSLARKALPTEPDIPLPNQVERTEMLKKVIDNSELLTRKRIGNYEISEEPIREPPRRNATFKKPSPPRLSENVNDKRQPNIDLSSANHCFAPGVNSQKMDATFNMTELSPQPVPPKRNNRSKNTSSPRLSDTIVLVKDSKDVIDINLATLNLTGTNGKHEEWCSDERAMVGSSESTDTATFSSSSPPEIPDTDTARVSSTPLVKKLGRNFDFHHNISPIYGSADDKYGDSKIQGCSEGLNVINTATIVRRSPRKGLTRNASPEKKMSAPERSSTTDCPSSASYSVMPPPKVPVAKSGLPTSKLRQYSSHRELRLPSTGVNSRGTGPARGMARRSVYASNPALSPTAPAPLQRTDSYTISIDTKEPSKPVLINPPVLIRQGTETLRRDRPLSQIVPPKDVVPPRPSSAACSTQQRVSRPNPVLKPSTAPAVYDKAAASAVPRPSRLPAPAARRTLRPPSVYSVAPTADADQY